MKPAGGQKPSFSEEKYLWNVQETVFVKAKLLLVKYEREGHNTVFYSGY